MNQPCKGPPWRTRRAWPTLLAFTAFGSFLGAIAGAALWQLARVTVGIEICRQDEPCIEITAPGTLAELNGTPSPWILGVAAVFAGAAIAAAVAVAITRRGWRLIREPANTDAINIPVPQRKDER